MKLTDDQIKAIKVEGRKIYPKIKKADLGYPNPRIPDPLLSEIKEFFKRVEDIAGYKVVESPLQFCENCFFGGDIQPVLDLFTKIDPQPVDEVV